ncbi:ABC transporter substrate-binding protein [Roseovarius sp. C7]|uniref:ABC transporter substrate-binding protein n=1 Tax=Roseovarius sp. C7 TaxID=3398643 RepID=UPI0039F6FC36
MKKIARLQLALAQGKISRRGFMQQGLAAGISLAALTGATAKAEASTPQKGGVLRVAKGHGSTTDVLDPGKIENGYTIALSLGGYQGYLTQIDADGLVQPSLAESWESSPDAKTWVFTLRQGLEFHNGRNVTPEDVIASVNHHLKEGTTSAAAPLVAAVTRMAADGPRNVVIELESGNADFPAIMSDYHLAIMPAADDGSILWQDHIGCGAYRIESHQAGIQTILTRHDNHWTDAVAHADRIELLSIIDQSARISALISGDVHAIDRVDLKTATLLGRKPGVELVTADGTLHYSFPMLCDRAPFDDRDVRMAVKYAVDRQELVDKILFGFGQVGNDHPIGANQRYHNDTLEQRAYDPDKARHHLKKAGHDRLKIELRASDAAFAGAVDAALLMQNSMRDAGIDLEVKRTPNDGFWAEHWMKSPFISSYWSGRPVEDQMFSTAYQSGVSWNETHWSNDRFDTLLIAARAELNDARRREMYHEMQQLVHEDGGALIPMFASYVFGVSDKIGRPEKVAANWDMDGERWMERWWIK